MRIGLTSAWIALAASVALSAAGAWAAAGPSWQGTILCTKKAPSGYRSFAVDDGGQVTELRLRRPFAAGLRVELRGAVTSSEGRFLSTRESGSLRVLGSAKGPFVVRTEVMENGFSRYSFYRRGRPWGCPVTFGETAAVSVAKLILSNGSAQITLALRKGRLVHLRPEEAPLAKPAEEALAKADLERFLALLSRGRSIAACATLSEDALLIHGGRDGCVIAFESAKFMYRDRYTHASVEQVDLFDLGGRSYAVGTITRPHGQARAILIYERGRYRYLGDFVLSPIELW